MLSNQPPNHQKKLDFKESIVDNDKEDLSTVS